MTATATRQFPTNLRGAVRQAMFCRDRRILVDGPAGTGKTRGLQEKAYVLSSNYPGARGLFVRKTRASMTTSVLVTWETHVLPDGSSVRNGPRRESRRTYEFPNGSIVDVAGMDNPERVMSTEYDWIMVFEATELTEEDIDNLTTRLRNGKIPYQQIICDCNPGVPHHHLKVAADTGRMTRFASRHEDNPTLFDSGEWTIRGREYLATLDNLTGARLARLRHGQWAAQEGLVYEDFDEAIHVVNQFVIPKDWRRIRSIDFGFTNPFVCQWWAVDGDGRMYLYREVYGTRMLVSDWAKKIVVLSSGERIEATTSDHDAEDRGTLDAGGVPTCPAEKAISTGIQAVQARLKKAGDGRPRLFILRDVLVARDEALSSAKKPCSTVEEMSSYCWPKGQDGKSLKEAPVDRDNHGMDAMRYAVMHTDKPPGCRLYLDDASVGIEPPPLHPLTHPDVTIKYAGRPAIVHTVGDDDEWGWTRTE